MRCYTTIVDTIIIDYNDTASGFRVDSIAGMQVFYQSGQVKNNTVVDTINELLIVPDGNTDSCPVIAIVLDTIILATCYGSLDGAIRIDSIDDSRINYIWNTGASTRSLLGIMAGSYSVTVSDIYSCSTTASFTITAPYISLPHPSITVPYTTCDSINTFVITSNYDTTKYQYWWEANNTVQQSDTIRDSSFVVWMNTPDSACNMIVYIRDKQTLCIDTMRIDILECCLTNSSITGGGVPIISNTSLTDYIHTYGIDNTDWAYRINGTFIIDTNFTFTNCHFYMEPYSSIVLNAGIHLIIDTCHIEACDTVMWYGFSMPNNTSTITMIRSYMSDAIIGIDAKSGAVCNMSNNILKLNRKGIVFGTYIGINPSTIISTTFITADNTDDFPNVFHDKLLAPHKDEIGMYGIEVDSNMYIEIGNISIGILGQNYFNNLHDGLYAHNSAIKVQNCNFKHMRRELINITYRPPLSTPIYNYRRGNAIEHICDTNWNYAMSSLKVQYCNTDSIEHAGIYMNGKPISDTIEYNSIKAIFGIIGQNLGNTARKNNYSSTIIRYNTIDYGYNGLISLYDTAFNSFKGIMLNNSKKVYAQIYNNTIKSIMTKVVSQEYGIYVSGTGVMSTINPRFMINDNSIINGQRGIFIVNLTQAIDTVGCIRLPSDPPCPIIYYGDTIKYNTITTKILKAAYKGISLAHANGLNIRGNTIIGRTSDIGSTNFKRGIELVNSKNNWVSCNKIDSLYYGLFFQVDCSMKNQLFGNNFNSTSYHIFGNGATAKLGSQTMVNNDNPLDLTKFPANKMNRIAVIRSVQNGGTVFDWGVKAPPISYDPWLMTPPTALPIGIISIPAGLSSINYTCPLPVMDGGGSGGGTLIADSTEASELLNTALYTDTISDEENLGAKQMSEEYIYDKLKHEPTLLATNEDLADYYEEKQDNYMGTLDEIKEAMSKEQYALADEKLAALEPNEYQQEADKIVYGIQNHLEQRATYICTEDEIYTLLEVANYCPIRYGAAVYLARTLLNSQEGYEAMAWDDDELCIEGVTYRIGNTGTTTPDPPKEGNVIRVYPNPAKSILYFDISENQTNGCKEIISYSIKSINGKKISTKTYDEAIISGAIDISHIADGVYIIEFECSDHTFTNIKFIINK